MSFNLSMIFYSAIFLFIFFANCQFAVKINHTNNEGEKTQMYSFPIFFSQFSFVKPEKSIVSGYIYMKAVRMQSGSFFIWKSINKN